MNPGNTDPRRRRLLSLAGWLPAAGVAAVVSPAPVVQPAPTVDETAPEPVSGYHETAHIRRFYALSRF